MSSIPRRLVGFGLVVCGVTLAAQPPPGSIERVSVATDGTQGNSDAAGWHRDVAISPNARYVAFVSWASNLVPGDTNDTGDIFVHDRLTRETSRMSVAGDSTQANGDSDNPVISADGRFVAFGSEASNLVANDTNFGADIFVHDRVTGATTRESVASNGAQANRASYTACLSADGRYVAFQSYGSNLVAGDTNGKPDIFVHDRATGLTERVSVATGGAQANGASDVFPVLSADGRYVAFTSYASNLVAGDTNGYSDVFVHDRVTHVTTRVSVASDGTQATGGSVDPAISADGRRVAFRSASSNLAAGDTNGADDIFVHDRATGVTMRVSVATGGAQANDNSWYPAISGDGRTVAFGSDATNLVASDTNGVQDLFVHDLVTGVTARASRANDDAEANNESLHPALDADGRSVAFTSRASNLVSDDTNDCWDVFVRDRGAPVDPPTALSAGAVGASVALAWTAPAAGFVPTSYVIEAGSATGLSDLAAFSTGHALTFYTATSVGAGDYFLRVRAVNAEWESAPSDEVRVVVGTGPSGAPGLPGSPTGLAALARGSIVSMSWTAPGVGGAPDGYLIEAGSAPGLTDLAVVATGNPTTSFVATGVPNGPHYCRVRAVNAWGTSGPSNEVSVVTAVAPPGAPGGLTWWSAGSAITLTWTAPMSGGTATAYTIEAGSAPGWSNLARVPTTGPSTGYTATGIGDGTYYVRARAANSGGVSAPSEEVALTVGCTAPPPSPSGLQGVAWGVVHLHWTAPPVVTGSSNGHTAYVLEAGSAPGMANLAVLELGGGDPLAHFTYVPDGVYYVRVKAKNACGVSGPSNEVQLVVINY